MRSHLQNEVSSYLAAAFVPARWGSVDRSVGRSGRSGDSMIALTADQIGGTELWAHPWDLLPFASSLASLSAHDAAAAHVHPRPLSPRGALVARRSPEEGRDHRGTACNVRACGRSSLPDAPPLSEPLNRRTATRTTTDTHTHGLLFQKGEREREDFSAAGRPDWQR